MALKEEKEVLNETEKEDQYENLQKTETRSFAQWGTPKDKTGESFSHKVSLERIHTGEKPFICLQCGKRFTLKVNFNRHVRSHTEEKPFACQQCGVSFAQHGHLEIHMKFHSGRALLLANIVENVSLVNQFLRVT